MNEDVYESLACTGWLWSTGCAKTAFAPVFGVWKEFFSALFTVFLYEYPRTMELIVLDCLI